MENTSMICTLSNMDILHIFCIKCTYFIRDRESLRTNESYTILLGWYWNQWSYWICNFQHHPCDSRMCIGCHAWLLLKLVVRYTRLWSLSNLHCSFVGNYFKRSNIVVRNTLFDNRRCIIFRSIFDKCLSNYAIHWYLRPEATLFLVLYVVYCVAMAFSSKVESAIAHKIPVPQSWREVQQVNIQT